jgi:hypothetical protein
MWVHVCAGVYIWISRGKTRPAKGLDRPVPELVVQSYKLCLKPTLRNIDDETESSLNQGCLMSSFCNVLSVRLTCIKKGKIFLAKCGGGS